MVKRTISECLASHNLDAERSVLGACLLHADGVQAIAALLKPHDFYLARHAVIFAALTAVYETKGVTDPIVVGDELVRRGRLEEAGGHDQLIDLLDGVVSIAGVEYHAEIVREHARRRGLVDLARDVEQRVTDGEDPNGITEAIERFLHAASAHAASTALAPRDIFAQWEAEGPLVHVPTGIPRLDELTGGGPPFGARCFILGAPDAGKTAFVVQVADHYLAQGLVVGFLAVDEDPGDVLMRFLQRRGFPRSDCERRDKHVLAAMAKAMADTGLLLYGEEHTIEGAAKDLAAQAKKRGRRGCFFIDSIQTARSLRELDGASPHLAVTARTRAMRAVTSAHGFISYATSEMTRAAYRTPDGADRVSDMAAAKESGSIEYCARFMLSLRSVPSETDLIEARIAKNKFGPLTREEESGIHLRLDRARQLLTEDKTYAGRKDGNRDDQRAAERNQHAVEDAAALALVIVDEPGIAKTDAEDELMKRSRCGSRRCNTAFSRLRHAIDIHPAPRNRQNLFLDGSKVPAEVLAEVKVDQRSRVMACGPHQFHRAAPTSTDDAGAPHAELHHHPLRSRGGAARRCKSSEGAVPPVGAGGTRDAEEAP